MTVSITLPPPVLVVELPLPAWAVSPNARGDRWTKAKSTKGQREDAVTVASAAMRASGEAFPIVGAVLGYAMHFPSSKSWKDPDNCLAMCKAYIDGMQVVRGGAGVYRNDSDVEHLPVKRFTDKKNPRLIVSIYRGPVAWGENKPPETGDQHDRRRIQDT